jgi:hypothetical protein
MAEQTGTRARHAAALNAAKAQLTKGDVKGYWQALEQISPDYAKLAGSVATGSSHGKGARERLQDRAEAVLGQRFTDEELQGIARKIAEADAKAREAQLRSKGHAGLSLKNTVDYHNVVFSKEGLPKDTYTLQPIADAIGKEKAAKLMDADPELLDKSLKTGWEYAPAVTDSAVGYLGDSYDAYKRDREQDIRDLGEEDPSRIENAPFGPHADKGDAPKVKNDVVSETPEGAGLGAEAARNAAEDKGETTGSRSPDASSPDAAKMKAALMPSDKDGGRDALLFKSVDQLTEAEALDLGRWYHGLQSSDPLRTELEKRRRDFYVLNYGNDPAPHDETGRMKPVQPIRRVPEKPTPAKSADGNPLVDGIRRIAGAVAKRAGGDGVANAAKVLQAGLNLAGQALKVDGDPGAKTRAGLVATVAKKGAAKTEEAVALGGFKRAAEAGRKPGRADSGLRAAVEKDVQPLFGNAKPKVAAETLQSSLNDLNAEAAEKRRAPKPEPLKMDGDIGPKTEGAFASALAEHGPDKVTKRYSDDLGFG